MDGIRKKAHALRLKGYSYNEINKFLGIPKSTLSNWFSGVVLSEKSQKRLAKRIQQGSQVLIERNKKQTIEAFARKENILKESANKIKNLSKRELLLMGAALYWAEGYKRPRVINNIERTSHQISFVNSDPDMIKIFIKFLREIINIPREKITLNMRLYNNLEEKLCKSYWKKVTGLSDGNFRKTTYLVSLSSKNKRSFNRLPFGTLAVGVADTAKFHTIMGFILGLKYAIKD